MKYTLLLITFIFLLSIFFIKYTFSLSEDFTKTRTCYNTWDNSCDEDGFDDAFDPCNGTHSASWCRITEIYVNQTTFLSNSGINAICEWTALGNTNRTIYMWYHDGSNWYKMLTYTNFTTVSVNANISHTFKVNSTTGEHIIRCIMSCVLMENPVPPVDECADSGEVQRYDNDDVNFTVTGPLTYDSWDLNITDYANLTRSDAVKAYAHWSNDLSTAKIRHNGTGSLTDYFFSPSGKWTNYTLDLSITSEFSQLGLINVETIWANDTYGLENTTSPSHYFYLWGLLDLYGIYDYQPTVYNGSTVNLRCKVADHDTYDNIVDYNVSFYRNGTLLGTVPTNSTGYAVYQDTAVASEFPQTFQYICNITSNPEIYYNITSQNSRNATVQVVEFGKLTDCSVLDEPGSYYLAQDIIDSSTDYCINITSNDVILNCKGRRIDGNDTTVYGIYVYRDSDQTTNITIKNCNVSDWNNANIYFYRADGNDFTNINSTLGYTGFHFYYSDSNTISNCIANSNDNYGFNIQDSHSNTISNVTANSNNDHGFKITNSRSNIILNSVTKENNKYELSITAFSDYHCNNKIENLTGSNDLPVKFFNHSVNLANEELSELILCNADNSNITNITINASQTKKNNLVLIVETDNSNFTDIISSENYYGFYLHTSNSNTFSNCSATKNNVRGFHVQSSNSNTFLNCKASSNDNQGFYLYYSDSNTINNSRIENNTNHGIYLSSAGQTGANKIYNNLFKNNDNFEFTGTIYTNSWNTTRQTGQRIYSPGTEIGGNYWTNSTGNGYSDTCNDTDYDDFCDDPYQLATDNIDYLPLTSKQKFSKVDEISLNESLIYNFSSVKASCKVIDNTTSNPIQNYNVSFYRNDTFLNWALTNSSGYANLIFEDTTTNSPANYIIKCNITDEPGLGYNASGVNSKDTTLKVIDLGIQAFSTPSSTTYGKTVEITANITSNASAITLVQANISFYNRTTDTFVIKDLTHKQSFSSTEHEYNLTYSPEWPSDYSVNITVQAGREKWDTTTFEVWGYSELDQITLNSSIIYNASGIQINCNIQDNVTNNPILNYNISFYRNDVFLVTQVTDANGLASYDYFVTVDNNAETLNFKCNITNQPSLYYNASSENSKNKTLQVYELLVDAIADPSTVDYDDTVSIIANISGNASTITSVIYNMTFTNISNGKLVQAFENGTMDYEKSYSPTKHEYKKTGTPSRSGDYDVSITVHADRTKSNTTSFKVSFGIPIITFAYPNYRVMINQTFNFTVNITSSGDLWYTNLSISLTNETVMNVTAGQSYFLPTLYNVSNSSTIVTKWSMQSKEAGLSGVTLNTTPQNGSSSSDFTSHSIMYPIIETTSPINVTDKENITVKIIGNITGISSINFSVFIPYTNDIINGTAIYVRNQTEATCTGEPLTSDRYTLHENYGGNATCNGIDCVSAIDNNTETSYMSVGEDSSNQALIIKLKSEETIERIILTWQNTTHGGISTIYYNSSGNWVTNPTISDLSPPNAKTSQTLTGFTPFKTNALKMNNTVNDIKVYEFEAYGTLGRVGLCYIYEYNFTQSTRSGTYSINTTTKTQKTIVTQPSSFFANYGYPQIEIKNETFFKGATNNYSTTITASNGDLRNLTLNLTIYNISVVQNSTPSETFLKNVPEILSGNSDEVEWNLLAMDDGITDAFITVNSTTNKGNYNQSEDFNIKVISQAGKPPDVANFWFSYQGVKTNETNLLTSFKIYANVSDDVKVDEVKANLTYPGGYNVNLSMSGPATFGWQTWDYTFETTNYPLNETGNYTVSIIAIDLGGQENVSGTYGNYPKYMTFYVNNTYTLELSSYETLYMRGEDVKVKAKDVNGNDAQNVNWYVNITKINKTSTETPTSLTEYTYQVKNNDPVGNYSIFANATKNGNSGIGSWDFNVSKDYSISVYSISPSSPQSPGSLLNIQFQLRDARDTSPTGDRTAHVICLNGSYSQETFPTLFTNDYLIITQCYASNSYSTSYDVYVNVSDDYNNTGENTFTFSTRSQEGGTPTGPSGGGGPARPTCTPEADYETNCTDEKDNDCDGATDCADADCSDFSACIKRIPDFYFNLSTSEIEIIRGENGTVLGSMVNSGNTKLSLVSTVDVEKSCCIVQLPYKFNLPVKASSDFSMLIHVNTSTPPGEYVLDVRIRYPPLENSKGVKVIVKEHPLISNILGTVPSSISGLILELNEYNLVGIDVSHLEDRINKIQETIDKAKIAVQEDDLELLEIYNNEINSDMEYIQSEMDRLSLRKIMYANKWTITYGIIIGLVSAYLAIQILVPFVKLSKEIVSLQFEKATLVQSRKETEKEYFLRKIDEQTFRRIVEQKHSQALKTTSTINLKKQQRRDLLRKRLNPLYVGVLIKSKLTKKES